jgi:hypothetical protein
MIELSTISRNLAVQMNLQGTLNATGQDPSLIHPVIEETPLTKLTRRYFYPPSKLIA